MPQFRAPPPPCDTRNPVAIETTALARDSVLFSTLLHEVLVEQAGEELARAGRAEAREPLLATITGIAAGMRNTGYSRTTSESAALAARRPT
jgi:hypothetical protein